MENKKANAKQLNEADGRTEGGSITNGERHAEFIQGDSRPAEFDEINPGMPGTKRRDLHKYEDEQAQDDTLKKGPAEKRAMQGDSEYAEFEELDPFEAEDEIAGDASLKKGMDEPQHHQGNSRHAEYSEMDPFEPWEMSKDSPEAFVKEESDLDAENDDEHEKSRVGKRDKSLEGEKKHKEGKNKLKKELHFEASPRGSDLDAEDDDEEEKDRVKERDKSVEKLKKHKASKMKLESLRKDIDSVFSGDASLSEEFKDQASKIFEAAVIARVNDEVDYITQELAEQNVADFEQLKEGLIQKVDSYLNYVVEQWMKDNEVAVENGLRTEVAEDFMLGLKNLFVEHYFEVPADRVNVLEDMGAKVDEINARLSETLAANAELKEELDSIKRQRIIESACKDLTVTDAEKMSTLLESIEFDNEKLFAKKVAVVKENYFPANTPNSPEKLLEEEVTYNNDAEKTKEVPPAMRTYADALSRIAKVSK